MASSPGLLTEFQDGVLTLTLNRPPVNAFNTELILAVQAAFREAGRDSQVRCVLLTGAGAVFSAGQDLTDFDAAPITPYRRHLLHTFNPLIVQIRRLEKPVLAAINGLVSGAALGLALACDLRIAADTAAFLVGFAGIGLAPDSAVSLLLPALIGLGRASELTYNNKQIGALQALDWGLVNRVVAFDQLGKQAGAWAVELAQGPVGAFGLAKRAFNKAVLGNLDSALDYEAHLQEVAGQADEHIEGIAAFLEKRPPLFR